MLRIALFSTLAALPAPVLAQDHASDAFGIVPLSELSEVRAAWSGLRTGADTGVQPPEPAEKILFLLGPKSLVAGKEQGHAVALILDRRGNPLTVWPMPSLDGVGVRAGPMATDAGHLLPDGAPVRLRATGKDGETAVRAGWVEDGHFETLLALPISAAPFDAALETPMRTERLTPEFAARPVVEGLE